MICWQIEQLDKLKRILNFILGKQSQTTLL